MNRCKFESNPNQRNSFNVNSQYYSWQLAFWDPAIISTWPTKSEKQAWQRVQPWIDVMEFFYSFFSYHSLCYYAASCAYNMRYEMIRGDRKRGNDPLHVIHKAVLLHSYCAGYAVLFGVP